MDDTPQNTGDDTVGNDEPTRKISHDRVFLVVLDDTPEMQAALTYAARRVRNSGGRLALLYVIEPAEIEPWMSVGDLIREERRQEAETAVGKFSEATAAITGQLPVLYIRDGRRREEIIKLIDEEPSISILVLAAGTGPDGPGPLVNHLVGKVASKMRVPITVVPGNLSDEEIERLT